MYSLPFFSLFFFFFLYPFLNFSASFSSFLSFHFSFSLLIFTLIIFFLSYECISFSFFLLLSFLPLFILLHFSSPFFILTFHPSLHSSFMFPTLSQTFHYPTSIQICPFDFTYSIGFDELTGEPKTLHPVSNIKTERKIAGKQIRKTLKKKAMKFFFYTTFNDVTSFLKANFHELWYEFLDDVLLFITITFRRGNFTTFYNPGHRDKKKIS